MDNIDKLFLAIIIGIILIILITGVVISVTAMASFCALMSFITGLIVDVLYIVCSALELHLRVAWSYKVPLPLYLLAIAATCGLTLVGQWYYSPLACSCPAPWYERTLSFLGGR